jgi:hypothetical protein
MGVLRSGILTEHGVRPDPKRLVEEACSIRESLWLTVGLALARGAWEEARSAFERALQADESPEALEGLGWAAWWLDASDRRSTGARVTPRNCHSRTKAMMWS